MGRKMGGGTEMVAGVVGICCTSLNPAKASRCTRFPPSFLLCSPRSLFHPIRHDSTSWLLAHPQPRVSDYARAWLWVLARRLASRALLRISRGLVSVSHRCAPVTRGGVKSNIKFLQSGAAVYSCGRLAFSSPADSPPAH